MTDSSSWSSPGGCVVYVDAGYLLAAAAQRVTGTTLRTSISVDFPALIEGMNRGGRDRQSAATASPVLVRRRTPRNRDRRTSGDRPAATHQDPDRQDRDLRRAEGRRPAPRPRSRLERAAAGCRRGLPGVRRRRPGRGGRGRAGVRPAGHPARRAVRPSPRRRLDRGEPGPGGRPDSGPRRGVARTNHDAGSPGCCPVHAGDGTCYGRSRHREPATHADSQARP